MVDTSFKNMEPYVGENGDSLADRYPRVIAQLLAQIPCCARSFISLTGALS
jgi:hypothetical protein